MVRGSHILLWSHCRAESHVAALWQRLTMQGCTESLLHVRMLTSPAGVQITGFDQVEHGEPWHKNMELFKAFTDVSQGVRRSGAAAIDMCHVACGAATQPLTVSCCTCPNGPALPRLLSDTGDSLRADDSHSGLRSALQAQVHDPASGHRLDVSAQAAASDLRKHPHIPQICCTAARKPWPQPACLQALRTPTGSCASSPGMWPPERCW